MDFIEFAQSHGLIIDRLEVNSWVRVPTEDKPSKKNGAYIWDGQSGAIQNWSVHEKPITFRSKNYDPFRIVDRQKIKEDQLEKQSKAKSKAVFMLNHAVDMTHSYLARKGFPDLKNPVWNNLLIVPMRINGSLVGCQMIDHEGNKKFLRGQITKGASLVIDNKGRNIVLEGYATGLSVREFLKQSKKRYTIHVCFSAGNMIEVAKGLHDPLVVADNDKIGLQTAQKIGQYWKSDIEGYDFNDAYLNGEVGNLLDLL